MTEFKMKRTLLATSLLALLIAFVQPTWAQQAGSIPTTKLEAERLANLNVPRSGHAVMCLANGEIVVFGGHTTGFVPTPTAEWFDGTAWHTLQMTYSHDQGMALPLSSGRVLLACGHEQPLGIGQTFTVETYNPSSRTFSSFGCLDNKRCFASAAELDSGRVLISGTWYAKDGLELWDGGRANRHVKDVVLERSAPYVLRTAKDDAIVFGEMDEHGEHLDSCYMVDRMNGAAYEETFLRTWHPVMWLADWRSDVCFVGDASAGLYAYIIPVQSDSTHLALALVDNGRFSLLSADFPVPARYNGHKLFWFSRLIADRDRMCGYLVGNDKENRFYILRADYADALASASGKVKLSLFVTDPLADLGPTCAPVLTPEGDLVLAGGFVEDNFNPTVAVYRLPLGVHEDEADGTAIWPWAVVVLCLVLVVGVLLIIYIRKRGKGMRRDVATPLEGEAMTETQSAAYAQTMTRLRKYMQESNAFLNSGLRTADVAVATGTTDRELSACLRRQGYRSFPDFVNALRVDYACELLREQPEIKIRALSAAAGFSSESAFYSAFSSRTGTTPKQWLAENN